MIEFDLDKSEIRELNATLHNSEIANDQSTWKVTNTKGRHAIAVGIDASLEILIDGHVGYYCAGMNKQASITINGHCGAGVAENMMSGTVHVKGNASQYAGATAHGGLLIIDGNASSRCGISMKGIDIVVKGNVGHMSAFMAQTGRLVVCGDAGDALGDSLYEARLYVRGKVASLGADCIEKPMQTEHKAELKELLERANLSEINVDEFRRYGSARTLYNFNIDNVSAHIRRDTSMSQEENINSWLKESATFPRHVIADIQRAAKTGLYDIRGYGAKRHVPSFDDLLFLGASMSRYALEGYREKCDTNVTIGTRFAKKPIELKIPITIAGMSFGALSAQAKEALGRGASEVGTSTTTGDGGMTPEERGHSSKLVYQLLPSRYGMNPDDLRKADAIEVVVGQGAKPGGGGMLLGQKISERVAGMRRPTPRH